MRSASLHWTLAAEELSCMVAAALVMLGLGRPWRSAKCRRARLLEVEGVRLQSMLSSMQNSVEGVAVVDPLVLNRYSVVAWCAWLV